MSKGPKIKEWVRWYIRTEALKNRAEPRDSVSERVEAYLEDKEPVPSRDTINKIVSEVRNSPDPEDSPWTVVDMAIADYPIPPEALPTVLSVQESETMEGRPLTIRQAIWVARLYRIFCISPSWEIYDISSLVESARKYASLEKAVKLSGGYSRKPEDTFGLWELYDKDLILAQKVRENDDRRYKQFENEQAAIAKFKKIRQESSEAKESQNERVNKAKG